MRTTILPAKFENLEPLRSFAGQAAKDAGLGECEIYDVELAVDEACTNIIEHAYDQVPDGTIECTCNPSGESLTIVLRDHGKPFNPTLVELPDRSDDVHKRKVGGLGLYLMYRLMDDVCFESLGEAGNVLTMIKHHKKEG